MNDVHTLFCLIVAVVSCLSPTPPLILCIPNHLVSGKPLVVTAQPCIDEAVWSMLRLMPQEIEWWFWRREAAALNPSVEALPPSYAAVTTQFASRC